MIDLVTGGARSGKSTYAEALVATYGDDICYIATAIAFDDGMKDRIKKHRQQRPSEWATKEAYKGLADFVENSNYDAYILDCVTIMVTNLMFDSGYDFDVIDRESINALEAEIMAEVKALLEAIKAKNANIVFVTNELGSGIVPADKMTRYFRDIAGRVNQLIGNFADTVTLVVCGQALKIKG